MTTTKCLWRWCFSIWARKSMTSCDAIRLSWSRKIKRPRLVIADIAETPPRFPVTFCLGVFPQRAQVLPSNAVRETFASSWKYRIALNSCTAARILGTSSSHPFLPLLLRRLEVFTFWLLVCQTGFMQPPHDRLLGQKHMESALNDLNQSPCGPKVRLISVLGGGGQDDPF